MASRSRVLTASVCTAMPLSFLKYRFAPTTAAPITRTPITMKMFFRVTLGSCERGPHGGNHQRNTRINDEHARRDWRRALLVQHAEANREADHPPDVKEIDRSE